MDGSLITAKNVGIVTILCAATATIIILNQPTSKIKSKRKKHRVAIKQRTLNAEQLDEIKHNLESRRQQILNEFERAKHKKIPEEMHDAMDYIGNDLVPELYPPTIRLLASQLIQDYAIMYTNINGCDPDPKIISLAKEWLNFQCGNDITLQVEQIHHRYALALRSRSIKEFKHLFAWLQSMDATLREQNSIRENWILRNFQCACLLGKWKQVKAFGAELEKVEPESLAANGQQQAPLHPLHLFEYIALKLPNQSANFTQVYYNVDRYISRFDPMLSPPLRFTEWQIKHCATLLSWAFSTNTTRNEELQQQIKKAQGNGQKFTKVPQSSSSRFMFVYGCLVQFPCFWVQLPASNTKMQPVVLTGPYNDTEMELTASYIRRMPQQAGGDNNDDNKNMANGNKQESSKRGKWIKVVRSDLRLKLDRKAPFNAKEENEIEIDDGDNDEKGGDEKNKKKKSGPTGWHWNGKFEHEEGILECYESDLNDFRFRQSREWETDAVKFTCREWNIHMIISTPD